MTIGKWIIVAFVAFAAFIGTLVTVCVRQDISLVSKDYYKEELAYQDQVIRISNTKSLKELPDVSFSEGKLYLTFSNNAKIQGGSLKVFRPSDAKQDKQFQLKENLANQSFEIQTLQSGLYRIKLWWKMNDNDYYFEKEIFI